MNTVTSTTSNKADACLEPLDLSSTVSSYTKRCDYWTLQSSFVCNDPVVQACEANIESKSVGNCIMSMEILCSVFDILLCPECKHDNIVTSETKRQGVAHIELTNV